MLIWYPPAKSSYVRQFTLSAWHKRTHTHTHTYMHWPIFSLNYSKRWMLSYLSFVGFYYKCIVVGLVARPHLNDFIHGNKVQFNKPQLTIQRGITSVGLFNFFSALNFYMTISKGPKGHFRCLIDSNQWIERMDGGFHSKEINCHL